MKMLERKLDASNICGSCNVDATDENIACFRCKQRFHAVKCGEERKQLCTQTFMDGWKSVQEKYKNIQFLCDPCLADVASGAVEDDAADKIKDFEDKLAQLNVEFKKLKTSRRQPAPVVKKTPAKPLAAVDGETVVDTEGDIADQNATDSPITEYENLPKKDKSRTLQFGRV